MKFSASIVLSTFIAIGFLLVFIPTSFLYFRKLISMTRNLMAEMMEFYGKDIRGEKEKYLYKFYIHELIASGSGQLFF